MPRSAAGVAVISTSETFAVNPEIATLVIEPSYEIASISTWVVLLISAMPSGAPFWIAFVVQPGSIFVTPVGTVTPAPAITRYALLASVPVRSIVW